MLGVRYRLFLASQDHLLPACFLTESLERRGFKLGHYSQECRIALHFNLKTQVDSNCYTMKQILLLELGI